MAFCVSRRVAPWQGQGSREGTESPSPAISCAQVRSGREGDGEKEEGGEIPFGIKAQV